MKGLWIQEEKIISRRWNWEMNLLCPQGLKRGKNGQDELALERLSWAAARAAS